MTITTTNMSAYDILGIDPNAPQKDVHAALRQLALAWHPDRVPNWRRADATLRFQAIMDAYNKIRTVEGRRSYDQTMSSAPRRRMAVSNDNSNVPLATKARAWLKAIETVFWPIRKS